MPQPVPLCPEEEIPDNVGRQFVIDGREIAVFRVEGRLYALEGRCAHQGGPLGQGEVVGGFVTCPWHGWTYEVASGRCTLVPGVSVSCLSVRAERGMVIVDLD